jgi:arginine decarboxylase
MGSYQYEYPELVSAIGRNITRIVRSLDNSVSNPEIDSVYSIGDGPLGALNKQLARAYGAKRACVVEGGSSNGNIRLGLALSILLGSQQRQTVLVDRCSHLSVFGALLLSRLPVRWLPRRYLAEHGALLPQTAEEIVFALDTWSDIGALWLTTPSYDGFGADLRPIMDICAKRNIILLADGAWGALHGILSDVGFPPSPATFGADGTVISLHKKGIGLSQSSLVLINNTQLSDAFNICSDFGLATTSPLYLLPAIVQQDLYYLTSEEGKQTWKTTISVAANLSASLNGIPGCRVVSAEDLGHRFVSDPCHIVLNLSNTGRNGYEILNNLSTLHKIDCEKATYDTLTILVGPDHHHVWQRLVDVLPDVINSTKISHYDKMKVPLLDNQPAMAPGTAFWGETEFVGMRTAVGRIAAQIISAYRPGYPILAPGEIIREDAINFLESVQRSGGHIKGFQSDISGGYVRCTK